MTAALKIMPSIAAGNLLRLADEVARLELAEADAIHFDVMDGHFVPLLTLGVPLIEQMKPMTRLPLDVHIMVTNPDAVVDSYLDAGADTLTFPIETALHAHRLCARIRDRGRRAGVALNPSTSWRAVEYLLPMLDQITIMAVNPGFSRQSHLDLVHRKIGELRDACATLGLTPEIQIDGGVNAENVGRLKALGATAIVAGGAVFNGGDIKGNIHRLRQAAALPSPS